MPSGELDLGGGRTLHVPKSLKGVGVFSFKKLCGENRGAADYLAIAQAFHTVILVGIPILAAWWPLGERPGVGTVLNILLIDDELNTDRIGAARRR